MIIRLIKRIAYALAVLSLSACATTVDQRQLAQTREFGYPFTAEVVHIIGVRDAFYDNVGYGRLAGEIASRAIRDRSLSEESKFLITEIAALLGSEVEAAVQKTRCMYFLKTENSEIFNAIKQSATSIWGKSEQSKPDDTRINHVFQDKLRPEDDALHGVLTITQYCALDIWRGSDVIVTMSSAGGTIHPLGNGQWVDLASDALDLKKTKGGYETNKPSKVAPDFKPKTELAEAEPEKTEPESGAQTAEAEQTSSTEEEQDSSELVEEQVPPTEEEQDSSELVAKQAAPTEEEQDNSELVAEQENAMALLDKALKASETSETDANISIEQNTAEAIETDAQTESDEATPEENGDPTPEIAISDTTLAQSNEGVEDDSSTHVNADDETPIEQELGTDIADFEPDESLSEENDEEGTDDLDATIALLDKLEATEPAIIGQTDDDNAHESSTTDEELERELKEFELALSGLLADVNEGETE